MRVKLDFCGRVYSLPPEHSIYDLTRQIVEAVEELAGDSFRVWYDDGEDRIILTSTAALLDAYQVCGEVLRLGVDRLDAQAEKVPCKQPDEVVPIKLAMSRLQAVGRVFVGEEFRGLSCYISDGILLTASSVLPDRSLAQTSSVEFTTSSFPLKLSPDKLWEAVGGVVFVSLQCSYSISEVEPLEFDVSAVPDSQHVATLKDSSVDSIKWHFIKKVTEERLVYVSNSPGGVPGGPVFGDKWQFLGVQLTPPGLHHQAARCADILTVLKSVPYSSSTVTLIQLLEPVVTHEDSYFAIARETPDPLANRVYGLPGQLRPWLLSYNVELNSFKKVNFIDRVTEGTAVCQLPNALFVSGGKDTKRKCWIGFLVGTVKWYQCDMLKSHYTHASVFFDGLAYVIGGRHSASPVRNVEAFEYLNRVWKPVQDLRFARSYPSAVEFKRQVYVLGGRTDTEDLDNVEVFNGHRWRLFEFRLPLALYGAGVFVLDEEKLLVCGGSREGLNYNRKVFTLNLSTGSFKVHENDMRTGLCSSSTPLYSLDSILFISAEGTIFKFCRHSSLMAQLRHEVSCAFD